MSYLIDSDVIIDFQKSKEPGASYFKLAAKQQSFISVITYSEIVYGIKNYPNSAKKLLIINNLLNDLKIEIIGVNKKEILEFIDIKLFLKKNSVLLADFDLIIAASAISNDLTLVTRNIKHFSRIPDLNLYQP